MVAAPTGSGKTGVFELAIARLLNSKLGRGEGEGGGVGWKIVYIAPVKALCTERVLDWRKKLAQVKKYTYMF